MKIFWQLIAVLAAFALGTYLVLTEAIKKVCINFKLNDFPAGQINWQSVAPGGQQIDGSLTIGIYNNSRINFEIKRAQVFIYYGGSTLMSTKEPVNISAPSFTLLQQNIDFVANVNLMTYQALSTFLLNGQTLAINYKFIGYVWGIPVTKKGKINLNPYANLNAAECEQSNN